MRSISQEAGCLGRPVNVAPHFSPIANVSGRPCANRHCRCFSGHLSVSILRRTCMATDSIKFGMGMFERWMCCAQLASLQEAKKQLSSLGQMLFVGKHYKATDNKSFAICNLSISTCVLLSSHEKNHRPICRECPGQPWMERT